MAGKTCPVCKKALTKAISHAGKAFCSKACVDRYKESEKKHVCEFC